MPLLPATLEEMFKKGQSLSLRGDVIKLDDAIGREEAINIATALEDIKAIKTIEIGVASGASALVICYTLQKMNNPGVAHYGIDPNQMSYYGGAAIANLKKEKLDGIFHLLEGPSHEKVVELIHKNIAVDFAFIDGWHTFDYTLVDFFLVDKLLRPGGIVAFHDMYGLAKQKVLRYIKTHRKYEVIDKYCVRGNEPYLKTLKFFIWRIYKKPRLLFSSYHWKYQLRNSSGLIFLKKKEQFEPPFHFYKPF